MREPHQFGAVASRALFSIYEFAIHFVEAALFGQVEVTIHITMSVAMPDGLVHVRGYPLAAAELADCTLAFVKTSLFSHRVGDFCVRW